MGPWHWLQLMPRLMWMLWLKKTNSGSLFTRFQPSDPSFARMSFGAYLTYRILDVSSVKVLARTWFGQGAVFVKPSAGEHDALVDVQNSIAELAHYRRTLFRPA